MADGRAEVEPSTDGGRPLAIGALSAMFTGYLRPHDAVRVGLMDAGDPAVEALATAVRGPRPVDRVLLLMGSVAVRFARPEDWAAVAGLLVELGRGVAAGTADDATHRMQFTGTFGGSTA